METARVGGLRPRPVGALARGRQPCRLLPAAGCRAPAGRGAVCPAHVLRAGGETARLAHSVPGGRAFRTAGTVAAGRLGSTARAGSAAAGGRERLSGLERGRPVSGRSILLVRGRLERADRANGRWPGRLRRPLRQGRARARSDSRRRLAQGTLRKSLSTPPATRTGRILYARLARPAPARRSRLLR